MSASSLVASVVIALASGTTAQVFSPGPLSSAHKQLDGIASCTQCHGEGNKHDKARCLDCHKEIKRRVDDGHGFHAKNRAAECAECHKEHKGGNGASLIEWSEHGFNHALAGWPLAGGHKTVECKQCHGDTKRIADADARALVVEKKRDRTFLGLSTRCTACHFDEHRGQEDDHACTECHTGDDWKPTRFVHTAPLAKFLLKGRHKSVACAKCHDDATDESTQENAWPKPRDKSFMQLVLKGVGQSSCTACHDDVHRGDFGRNCVKCHSEDGWKIIKQAAEDTGFHDKTEFPLRGEHTSVTCKACHGPFPALGQRAGVFKGLKHAQCADCHADAHEGQLPAGWDCAKCHAVTGFVPVSFDVAAHKDTRFPLEGGHRAVACNLCHKSDKGLARKVPASLKKDATARGRPVLVSDVKLAFVDAAAARGAAGGAGAAGAAAGVAGGAATAVASCETCHADPHGGQFAGSAAVAGGEAMKARACAECHATTSFSDVTLNHDDTRFPLTGKHKSAACAECHGPKPDAKGRMRGVVVYRPLAIACAQCHRDEHAGQLAARTCDACHATTGFKPATFDHAKQSTFALEGKHKDVRCAGCHVVVDGPWKTAKYKQVSTACASCHEDDHKGAFEAFAPGSKATTTTTAAAVGCARCHQPAAWSPAAFAHERTPFALRGKHRGIGCVDCHGADTGRPIPTSCAGCHQDPHAQEFGLQCRSCHNEDGFAAPTFMVDAHRKGAFPLVGRHAALPCEECHVEKRERTFTRASVTCAACHAKDARKATLVTVDHGRAPFSGDCRACHQPLAFSPAALPQHEACFPIARGVHAPVACNECHRALRGTSFTGSCNAAVVACAECHVHGADVEAKHHRDVPGYEHKSEKCAACHHSAR